MSNPLVSVIVPVYKVEQYVGKCLDSIVNQLYKDLEIIVVDDGSPDGSSEICQRFAEKDNRIKYIRKENGGLSSARNAGLKVATGKYLTYVDSDDYIKPDMISEMVALAEENELYLVKSNFCRCNSKGEELPNPPEDGRIDFYTAEEAVSSFLNDTYSFNKPFKINVWDALYLREAFEGIDFPEGKLYEDGYYTPLVLLKSKKAAHINKSYYVYRINEQSIMGEGFNPKSLKSLDDWEFIHNHISAEMPQFKLTTAKIWAERLVGKYEKIISDDSIDEDGYYKNLIRNTFSDNFNLFKEACGKCITIKKIKCIINKPEKYYETYILLKKDKEPFIIALKSFAYFIITYRKDLLKCIYLFFEKVFRKRKKIFLLGSPSYNNIGDHAIALGVRAFVEEYFPDYLYEEFDRLKNPNDEKVRQIKIKASLKRKDLIFLIGGGNFGSLYPVEEEYRRTVISNFKKNKIVFLSSTMFFENSYFGRCELKKSKQIYESHPDLTLLLRDERSYGEAKKHFSNLESYLAPDFANMLISRFDVNDKRNGIYICFRKDGERFYNDIDRDEFIDYCKKITDADVGDNAFESYVDSGNRYEKTFDYLKFFSKHKLVVTDRFHGVIFAAITKTPCIALKNNNKKVEDGFYWFNKCKSIKLAESLSEAKDILESLLTSEFGEALDFKIYFDKIAEIIKK